MRGGFFFCLSWLEITSLFVSSTHILAFSLNKVVFLTLSFYLTVLCFSMFLPLTYCGVCLFVGFCVADSDSSVTLIR